MTSRYLVAMVGALLLGACSGKAPMQTARTPATATAAGDADAVANLLYIGKRAMGALEYAPALQRKTP